jgi:hypothetical protein
MYILDLDEYIPPLSPTTNTPSMHLLLRMVNACDLLAFFTCNARLAN